MSNVKIEGNASGTGTFTIAAPNSNTDRTLTLPDEAGTVLTSAGAGTDYLTPTGDGSGLTGTGKVLQVVQGTASIQVSTTSISYQASGLTVSITPSSTSNKILVMYHSGYENSAGSSLDIQLWRNSTAVSLMHRVASNVYSSWSPLFGSLLDSPSTTSAITYQLYYKSATGNIVYLGSNDHLHRLIAMEIAG